MNAPVNLTLDKPTFLRWVQGRRDGRYELEDGKVIMHAGGTRRHAETGTAFVAAFRNRLSVPDWVVTGSDFSVDAVNSIRFPDLLVARRGIGDTDLSTDEPVVLVEVLSPSPEGRKRDFVTKPAEYFTLATLEIYIVAEQERPEVWVWQRGPSPDRAFPDEPQHLAGCDKAIEIRSLGITVPLAEVYAWLG
jgi:Uma2 family endonuclease